MDYAFESWAGSSSAAQAGPDSNPAKKRDTADAQLGALSDDLKSLEESMSMTLDDVLATFQPEPDAEARRAENAEVLSETLPNEQNWDELARMVADHVLVYMQEAQHPLQIALEKMRRTADEYYRDNRAMAVQIRQLLDEREQMIRAMGAYEVELDRYGNLLGNLYLRR